MKCENVCVHFSVIKLLILSVLFYTTPPTMGDVFRHLSLCLVKFLVFSMTPGDIMCYRYVSVAQCLLKVRKTEEFDKNVSGDL